MITRHVSVIFKTQEHLCFFFNWHQPPDVSEPAVQVAGGAGESVRNQAVKAVEAVHQKLPLCAAFS